MRLYSDASHDEGVIGIGYVIRDEIDDVNIIGKQYVQDDFTSMQAEYTAMMSGIHAASWYSGDTLLIQTDCDPLAEKMRYPREDDEQWFERWEEFHTLVNTFDTWSINSVPREQNGEADRLAKEALWFGREEVQS